MTRTQKRQCFISVMSTGYKLYFLSILINVKLFEKKNTMNDNKFPPAPLDSSGFALTVTRFESFFLDILVLFIYAKTHVTIEHFVEVSGLPRRETQHKRVSRKINSGLSEP